MKKAIATLFCAIFVTALIAQTGTPKQTKADIKPSDLPKCVSEWVTKNMEGYKINKAIKWTTGAGDKMVVTYYVRVVKEKSSQWLLFDAICKEVKKIPAAEAEKAPKTKPPQ